MKKVNIKQTAHCLLLLSGFAIISCGSSASSSDNKKDSDTVASYLDTSVIPVGETTHAEAVISGTKADTAVDGKATFDDSSGKVKMKLELTIPKMANKSVAVHLHEHPDCGDNGMATHGHWNPTHEPHGKWGSDSFHLGDIGNVKLDAKGKGTKELTTDLWSLGGDTSKSILNRAIIVHSGVDDYKSQPAGNAGSRIGCGVIAQ